MTAPGTIAFTATEFGDDTDDDARTVGLADAAAGDGHYLMLQIPTTPLTAQDTALGMDTYYLEIDGQGRSRYGGVAQCRQHGGVLSLELTEDAATDLDCERLTVALDLPETALRDLNTALRAVFTFGDPAQQPRLDLA